MAQAKQGNTVRVHYTGKLDDDTVFYSSANQDPLQPEFEQAVTGMSLNESKTVTIPTDAAYGPHRPEMVAKIPRTQ